MTNTTKKLAALSLLASLSLLAACSSAPAQDRTPYLDAHFGDAVSMAKAQQTLNPNASQNRDAVAGIDGRAGREAVERYESSFQKPQPQPNVFGIGVGGSSGQ